MSPHSLTLGEERVLRDVQPQHIGEWIVNYILGADHSQCLSGVR